MTRKRHIAIVTSGLGAGGAERVIAQITGHWARQGHKVSIISFDRPDDIVYHKLDRNITIHRLAIMPRRPKEISKNKWQRRFSGLSVMCRRVIALRRFINAERPDLLFSFLTKINLIALIATIGLRVPVGVAERNNPEKQDANPLWNIALRHLYKRAAAIICQTQASMRCIPAHLHERCHVIPNPVHGGKKRHADRKQDRRVIGAVGRLSSQKGFDMLVTAFAMVASQHPEWDLHIWGDGPDREMLQDQINRLDLTHRIKLCGLSQKAGAWVGDMDIFILSSRYEGFPNVLAEAMVAGLPVIATNCDFGPAEMVEHGHNGLLIRPDRPQDMAVAIDRLISNTRLRRKLASKAPEIGEKFAAEPVMQQWDELTEAIDTAS